MALLVFYVLLALGVSFLCSIMEAVLLSISSTYVSAMATEGKPQAKRWVGLKANVDRPLSAILTLNTIAHTFGAAGAGAQAQHVFGDKWITLSSIVLTLLILIFSEIIPKTIGALYWRKLSGMVAWALDGLIVILKPFVWLSERITQMFSSGHPDAMSRSEFEAMADIGHEKGVIDAAEMAQMKHLLQFGRLRVKDAMTPRTVMTTFPESWTVGDVLAHYPTLRFSRIPLAGDRPDDLSHYVLKSDVLFAAAKGEMDRPLTELQRPIMLVGIDTMLREVLGQLMAKGEHIALAMDEYGALGGVITMEDLVETLLGMEIVDEVDTVEDMQALAREQWRRRVERLGVVAGSPSEGGDGEG